MILQIHQDASLKKSLHALRKAGGRSALVADHAESVMEKLILAGDRELKRTVRRTRNGEARIKKCVKFDLIDGYRLIGIRQAQEFIFLYIGTHDECDRWIRNNTGLRIVTQRQDGETAPFREHVPSATQDDETPEPDPSNDDFLTHPIDDKTLRIIFRGLTGT